MPAFTLLSSSEQVVVHLRKEIFRGHWSGTMPGELALAKELEVDRKTVGAALRELEVEGVLVGQGAGRRRKIVLPEGRAPSAVRVALFVYDIASLNFVVELQHLLEKAGHAPFILDKTLCDLGMDVRRVARLVQKTEADAWLVVSASREVLEWFAKQEAPAFAIAGRRRGLPIAGTGPDKSPATAAATRHLIKLGHRLISLLICKQHRLPQPGKSVRAYLGEFETAGITAGAFNLPDWEESKEGFEAALDSLFWATPPTALILDEPHLYNAAHHYLARRGLRVPEDVSLICTDDDPTFVWCQPSVAHIHWDYRPMIRSAVRWVDNTSRGKKDIRQSFSKAEFIEGGTIGPVA